ncbi:MAG: isoprenylcysteine carboxylmethyltransferase family protein [Hyphomicrobiaceae bacterium]|nr:isoprenylcysteine carboxylmethyltransferase family protein [Hyphomicrobiaceae bacterium]
MPLDGATDRRPVSVAQRTATALIYAALCHGLFGLAILSMTGNMFFGMTFGQGRLEGWLAVIANGLLIAQFAGGHSLLLTRGGNGVLKRLAPRAFAADLLPTTYVIVASLQLLALFVLWSPSGIVWWRAEGTAFWLLAGLALVCWALLGKAILDSGFGLQSGLIGWWAVLRGRRTVYPDMPESGLFRIVRQPIYVAFALGCWAVAIWTPDQLAIALTFTTYCVLAPLHKEARFRRLYGARFEAYAQRVPYWLPVHFRRGPDSKP